MIIFWKKILLKKKSQQKKIFLQPNPVKYGPLKRSLDRQLAQEFAVEDLDAEGKGAHQEFFFVFVTGYSVVLQQT